MKKKLIFSLITITLLPLLAAGCTSKETVSPTAPETQTVEITLDEFATQNHIVKNVDLALLGTLTVRLGSNPTTGYSWGEPVFASDIARLISHTYISPEDSGLVGAGGTDVWIFESMATKAGTATIKFSYSRSWEGGEKDTYTLTINVTLKY